MGCFPPQLAGDLRSFRSPPRQIPCVMTDAALENSLLAARRLSRAVPIHETIVGLSSCNVCRKWTSWNVVGAEAE
jgi:hypothetical protein